MATRDEVYCKFGLAAEAAQLFETELSTVLLAARGLEKGWYTQPDADNARKALNEINAYTLGALLKQLKASMNLDDALKDKFGSALKARNRLSHGFFEQHNFRIQTDRGRDIMIADLEILHDELFQAWQSAAAISHAVVDWAKKLKVE